MLSNPTEPTGSSPNFVTSDPAGAHIYIANFGGNSITSFTIDSGGALTSPLIEPTGAGTSPWSVVIHPTGNYAYVANWGNNSIGIYTVGTNGSLTFSSSISAPVGPNPNILAIGPSGKHLYVSQFGDNNIGHYTINMSTGGLTHVLNILNSGAPLSMVIDPTGRFLYTANGGSADSISIYPINPDGSLAAESVEVTGPNSAPSSLAIDPAGQYLYSANGGNNTVSQYTINSDGSISTIASPISGVGAAINSLVTAAEVDPSGKYLYVTDDSDSWTLKFDIAANGSLSNRTQIASGTDPWSISTVGTWQ